MPEYIATITKWIVAFLVIFLLLMILLCTFLYASAKKKSTASSPSVSYR